MAVPAACGHPCALSDFLELTALTPPPCDDIRDGGSQGNARTLTRLIRAFDPVAVDGARLSEDFSFCHRWRQCGGQIWADTAPAITPVGLYRFATPAARASAS